MNDTTFDNAEPVPETLDQYRSVKIVHAAKIAAIERGARDNFGLTLTLKSGAEIVRTVGESWVDKHRPEVGGYFVEYADGHRSYSPTQAFEDGCLPLPTFDASHLPPHRQRLLVEKAELDERLSRLTQFLRSETSRSLDVDERDRLLRQQFVMAELAAILAERVAVFTPIHPNTRIIQ